MKNKPDNVLLLPITPRGMSRAEAAAYCACTPRGFDSWVSRGIVPGAMPGTKRWDRKAIDAALDKLSELPPPFSPDPKSPEAAFDEWQNKNARAA